MIVFKPETVTKLHISINTKEDADLLRTLSICAGFYLEDREFKDRYVRLEKDANPILISDLTNLILDIKAVTHKHSNEFIN